VLRRRCLPPLKEAEVTGSTCPAILNRNAPVSASTNCTSCAPSSLTVAMVRPSGENTENMLPWKVHCRAPLSTSHTHTSAEAPTLAKLRSSEEKCVRNTMPYLSASERARNTLHVVVSHKRIELPLVRFSGPPIANHAPVREFID